MNRLQFRPPFLTALASTCDVKATRAEEGMTAASAYNHRKRWGDFARRWNEAEWARSAARESPMDVPAAVCQTGRKQTVERVADMRSERGAWALAAAMLAAAPVQTKTARPMLDYATAAAVRDGCIAWAGERGLNVAVAVYDDAGRLITFAHMDGAATAVAEFAMWKGRSAATIRFPSSETGNWGDGPPSLATWEGGLPFYTAEGAPLGGVGVSGAESADDAACGAAGIAAAALKGTAE